MRKLLVNNIITKINDIRFRQAYRIRMTKYKNVYEKLIAEYMVEQESRVLVKLGRLKGYSAKQENIVSEIYQMWDKEVEMFVELSKAPLAGAMKSASSLAARHARGIEMLDNDIAIALFSRENRIRQASLNQFNQIKIELGEGIANNETTNELSKRIRTVYDTTKAGADRIARTEVGSAMSKASLETYKENNVQMVRWISSRDDRTRETHLYNDSVGPLPTGSIFPGSGEQHPGQHDMNCRCCLSPVIEV